MGAQWKTKIKEGNAAARGKLFTKLVKELTVAARNGADPDMNPRLRMAMDAARKQSLPRDTLERAVKKGAGLLDEKVTYETVVYEGFTPHKVPIIVECLTDNKNRTASNLRVLFRKGQLGSEGSVAWDFKHLGFIEATPNKAGIDPEEAAIEAGAQDLEVGEDGAVLFYTEPTDLDVVSRALQSMDFTLQSARLGYKPNNPMTVDDATARAEVEAFLQAVDEDDDVQHVYVALAD